MQRSKTDGSSGIDFEKKRHHTLDCIFNHHILPTKMISLLIHAPTSDNGATAETRFGGRPSAPADSFIWPTCTSCDGNMQFLGQLRANDGDSLLLLFMCQNDPGMCEEWDANEGGNKVIAVGTQSVRLIEPPPVGEVTRPVLHGAALVQVDSDDYDEARDIWCDANDASARQILGQTGGEPAWIQGDETPACGDCGNEMSFVAQLEEGTDHETAMNFGGGCAYVYQCTCKARSAKMLWQC